MGIELPTLPCSVRCSRLPPTVAAQFHAQFHHSAPRCFASNSTGIALGDASALGDIVDARVQLWSWGRSEELPALRDGRRSLAIY